MSRSIPVGLRKAILDRDNHTCRKCGKKHEIIHRLNKPDIHRLNKPNVHHIIPVALQGTDDESNLITLCFDCHRDIETGLGPIPIESIKFKDLTPWLRSPN